MEKEECFIEEFYMVKGKGIHVCCALAQEKNRGYRLHGWMTLNNKDRQCFRSGLKERDDLINRFGRFSRALVEIFGVRADRRVLETPVVFDQSILTGMAAELHFN